MKYSCLFCLFVSLLTSWLTGQSNPIPYIQNPLVPSAALPASAGFNLTVNGSSFVSGSVISWNNSPRATTFINGSQLVAKILPTDIARPGTARVTVASPGGLVSAPAYFEITSPTSAVTLSRADYSTNITPRSITTGDFNHDGKLDVAVLNSMCDSSGCRPNGTVSILLGGQQGSFLAPVSYPVGYDPFAIAAGDLNGDGNLDLIVVFTDCNAGCSGAVDVLLGNANGTFQSATEYSTGLDPRSVALGDLNADGKLDVVTGNFGGDGISILLGNGDGTLQPHTDYSTGDFVTSVAIGDFNRDDKLDIAATNFTAGSVSVFLGNGNGTVGPPNSLNGVLLPETVMTADFNRDGNADLAISDCIDNPCLHGEVSIYLGNGDGTFQLPTHIALGNYGSGVLNVADLNGDGLLDVIATGTQFNGSQIVQSAVFALLGKGDGTFNLSANSFLVGADPVAVSVGDFNSDGRFDVVTANNVNGNASVLLQVDPNLTATVNPTTLPFPPQVVGTSSSALRVSVTNNGISQLIFGSPTISGDFAIQSNFCSAGAEPATHCDIFVTFTPTATGMRTGQLTIQDSATNNPQTVSLYGTGSAIFVSPSALTFSPVPVGSSGTLPVTITNRGPQSLALVLNLTATIPGTYSQSNNCGTTLASGSSCVVLVTCSPEGGPNLGSLTITDADPLSPQIVSLTGTGIGNSTPFISLPLVPDFAPPGSSGLTLTVNGANFLPTSVVFWNGAPRQTKYISSSRLAAQISTQDLAHAETATVYVSSPAPEGGVSNVAYFSVTPSVHQLSFNRVDIPVGSGPRSLGVADFNRDGNLDVVTTNVNSQTISVLLGRGDGTFLPRTDIAASMSKMTQIAVGDFNEDGNPDFAVASGPIMLGKGNGNFTTAGAISSLSFALGDINLDGELDFVLGNAGFLSPDKTLLGNGDGTFRPGPSYNGGRKVVSVVTGDFNGDGKLDIANIPTPQLNSVCVMLGAGDGTFGPQFCSATGFAPQSIVAGDFNRDGKLDVAITNTLSHTISVFLGNGDGTLQPKVDYATGAFPFAIATADLNADGNLDLVVTNATGNSLSIFLGLGNGAFQFAQSLSSGVSPKDIAVADLNGDGRLDLLVANAGSQYISLFSQIPFVPTPAITLAPTALSFGSQKVGTSSAPQSVLLTNSGTAPLTISGITILGTNKSDFKQTNNCPASLVPGASCTLSAVFTPTATGTRVARISITDNASGSPQSVKLSGTGV